MAQDKITKWIKRELEFNADEYRDSAGELQLTPVAENCASDLGVYVGDWGIPEFLFKEVYDIALEMKLLGV